LKEVVLGIGQFTILDPEFVKEEDLGVNFFLDPSSLGKSRAEESVKFLCELNVDVKGNALVTVSSLFPFILPLRSKKR